jgi:hypothetical protein
MGAKLSAAQKKSLRRDGFVVLPRLVPPSLTAPAIREMNNRLGAGESAAAGGYAEKSDYRSEHAAVPAIMNLAKGPLREVAESLLGAGKVEPLTHGQAVMRFPSENDSVLYKPLLHIDGLSDAKGDLSEGTSRPLRYSLCAGVLLSDTPRPGMGNLTVYPGTHRRIADLVAAKGLGALTAGIESQIRLPAPVPVTGKTGDAVLFHFQLVHDRGRNDSPHIRRACYFRFWHIDAWRDLSGAYLERAMSDPWLEWPGMRGAA